ncbi:MAG TPA: NnrS family protein [Gammaproteobacteria bacterium]|jgi:uncharacterized protein involved in response to NO|nr:NnrS family protein [Gammaproteobacteria bacterium]
MTPLNSSLLSCGFRPFFLLASGYAVLLMTAWLFFWKGWLALPDVLGGFIAWHIYELVYGFVLAAIIGFITTATPEFVDCKEINRGRLFALVLLWLAGRIAFWMSGAWGLVPAAMTNLALLISLLVLLAPPIWRDPGRPHMSFIYALTMLAVAECGFYISGFQGAPVIPWLMMAIGIVMILIIIALSRISMRVINGVEEGIDLFAEEVEYLARPPRRNMAMFTIGLYTVIEFIAPGNAITGWLALAAAAAMLNLLNDWHIGRPLLNKWVFSLYSVYWLIALGYGLIGLSILADWPMISAARHLLTTGAIGFAIFLIMVFAGQVHSGRTLEFKNWMLISILALIAATIFRVSMSIPLLAPLYMMLLMIAAALWILAFSLYFIYFRKILLGRSADGRSGCL